MIQRLDKILHDKKKLKKKGAIRMVSKIDINYHARKTILKERKKI